MILDISKLAIPSQSGIYIMKDSDDKMIYIGKAKNLRNRVKSYFIKNQNYKTQKLVEKISEIEFVITDNEEEAFLLEANLIKRYRPPYNIELKDQQRYTYLRLTDEAYPRLMVARRTRTGEFLGGGRVYGPFTHGSSKILSVGTLRKTFKVRICKKLPKEACLEYHLGNCDAPCQFKNAQENYGKNIEELESILKGKQKLEDFVDRLEIEMKQASGSLQYERAKEIHATLQRLSSLQIRQKMESPRIGSDEEYFGIKINDQTAYLMSFRLSNGVIKDRNKFSFEMVGDNSFSSFLSQYYSTNPIPKYIIVNEIPEKQAILEEVLSHTSGDNVKIIAPKSGKRREIINLIMRNVSLIVSKDIDPAIMELQEKLDLEKLPKTIECFDISNYWEDYAVGSMSCLIDGQPYKSGYRKFKIKTVKGRDDFAMIKEIVKRRYLRLKEEKSSMPDLVLIDGGRGQLNAAHEAMQSVGVKIPCISLAKENEEIYQYKLVKPIILPRNNPALKVLQYARDEAHRFGLAYNKAIRKFT